MTKTEIVAAWNRRAALAAAPPAPSPAYGGVKEPERCPECRGTTFAQVDDRWPGGGFRPGSNFRCVECKLVTPGISTVAVEEADAKAGRRRRFTEPMLQQAYDALRAGRIDPESIRGTNGSGNAYAVGYTRPDVPNRIFPKGSRSYAAWAAGVDNAIDDRAAASSTPSPQIGNAGAVPVGEAVAFEFDRYIDGTLMAEGVKIERQPTLEKASRRAAQIAPRGPNGEVPVLVLRSPLYARPVDEPGEVERLTRERDEARALVDECCYARDSAGFLGSVPDCIEWLKDERSAAEAALAETRERLEKLVAASSKARTALAGFTSADDAAFALDVAIGEVADWKRSAALTGDAREAGQ